MKTLEELLVEQAAIEKAILNVRKTQKKAAIAQVRELLDLYKISAKEIDFPDIVQSVKYKKPAKKYMNNQTKINIKLKPKYQDDAGNKWTGRGKCPRWLAEAESKGHLRTEFLIP